MKIYMLVAIARLYELGKNDICLCLVGPKGRGKLTFFRFLAIMDEWFTDDLKCLDNDNICRKKQGHWIIELAEMTANANAKSIEETKVFISRQKETYQVPYDIHPEDKPRQRVFCGTQNDMQFIPFDRPGNRRFAPVRVNLEKAEVFILDNKEGSRNYILQM